MANQIIFLEKNKADYEEGIVTVTASQGQATADRILNRSNLDAWTSGTSLDSDNTTLVIDMIDPREIDNLIFCKHNFKSFKAEYWDGLAYQSFSPAADVTNETSDGTHFEVAAVNTTKIKVTIRGTQTPDSAKILYQFIATRLIGQLNGWPIVKDPKFDRDLRNNKMLSNKKHIVESVDAFSVRLQVKNWTNSDDLEIVETLHEYSEGFLIWISAGDEAQFKSVRKGYRFEDIFLVRPTSIYSPEFVNGFYKSGFDLSIDFSEVIT